MEQRAPEPVIASTAAAEADGATWVAPEPVAPVHASPSAAARASALMAHAPAAEPVVSDVVASALSPPQPEGDARVPAQEITSLSRLGGLLDRTMNDYPREVQAPVRIYGSIEARYPPEARAQGIEGVVVAWVLVDPAANVEEIQIVDGDPVFHDAVIDAIRRGIFKPAFDDGQGLHYPIGLEFRFALDHAGAPQDAPVEQVAAAPAATTGQAR